MSRKLKHGWALLALALLICSCSAPPDLKPQGSDGSGGAVGGGPASQGSPAGNPAPPGASVAPKRWLIVCLDGVPLSMVQSLWNRGHFHEFFAPTAVVSTFPSDTETALTEALHAMPAPGYEHDYYDRVANRMRGGALVTIFGTGIPYIPSLDYDTNGWFKALAYLAPIRIYRSDLSRFKKKFQASRAPVFVAHLATSDALVHVRTAEQVEPLLVEFESVLRGIYGDAHGELGVILFSDHGDTETLSRSVPVESFLANRGWRVRASLAGPRDAVIPSYGLVGFAAIYCQSESIERLAEDLRGLQGADFIVSHEPAQERATLRAAGSDSTALLEWSPDGRRYRYIAHGGDPLVWRPCLTICAPSGSSMRMASRRIRICLLPLRRPCTRIPPPGFARGPRITSAITPIYLFLSRRATITVRAFSVISSSLKEHTAASRNPPRSVSPWPPIRWRRLSG